VVKRSEKARTMRKVIKAIWIFNWFNSCGFAELVPVVGSRWDMERFGMIIVGTPRHADVMVVSGSVPRKIRDKLKRIYDQMPEPKFVVAVGSCAITGGVFQDCYNVFEGVDKVIPVDAYIPGCPPKPEAILDGVVKLLVSVGY